MTDTTNKANTARHTPSTSTMNKPSDRPEWSTVKQAVIDKARARGVVCSGKQASLLVSVLYQVVDMNEHNGRPYRLNSREVRRLRDVLKAVIPSGVTAPPYGSAHDLLNRRVLRRRQTFVLNMGNERRSNSYCAIGIRDVD